MVIHQVAPHLVAVVAQAIGEAGRFGVEQQGCRVHRSGSDEDNFGKIFSNGVVDLVDYAYTRCFLFLFIVNQLRSYGIVADSQAFGLHRRRNGSGH